ncbi:unnamed protein product [Heterobilharzia americana]|nr:unnamed protein product [Heterobilharzia americana]
MDDLNNKRSTIQLSKLRQILIHYRLLIWKNLLLRKRRPGFLIAEILVPLIIPIILVTIRTESLPIHENICHIRSTNLPTMGLFSYIQSLLCNFLFRCQPIDPDEISQQFDYTSLGDLLENISNIFESNLIKNITKDLPNFNMEKFLQLVNNSNDQTFQQLAIIISNIQQIYQSIFNDFNNDSNQINNEIINFNSIIITTKQIRWLSNLSKLICGTKTQNVNDIEKILEILKGVNFSNILDMNEKLKRIRRTLPNFQLSSKYKSIKNIYTINCSAIDNILRNPIFLQYTGRIRYLLYGHIFYHPVNEWTNEIIYRTLEPQRLLISLKNLLQHYQIHTGPILYQLMTNTSIIYQFRKILNYCSKLNNSLIPENIKILCLKTRSWLNPKIIMNRYDEYHNKNNLHWSILFNQINILFDIIIQLLNCFPLNSHIYGVINRLDFDKYIETFQSYIHPIVYGILFNDTQSQVSSSSSSSSSLNTFNLMSNTSIIITIRQSSLIIDETNDYKVYDYIWLPKPRNNIVYGDIKYFTSGFIDIQDLLSNSIINILNNQSFNNLLIGKQMKFFPNNYYINDKFINNLSKILPQLILLTFILTSMLTTKFIVEEKENYIKEFTKIIGLSNYIHWLGWFSITFSITLPITIIIIIILKYGQIIILSNIFIIFLLFISYIISIIIFSFLCSVFFQQANLSAIVTGLFYFIIYLPIPLILTNEKVINQSIIYILSLSNQVAFCLGFYSLIRLELQGFGIQWYNLWESKINDTLYSPVEQISIDLNQCTTEDYSMSNLCIESNTECLPVGIYINNLSKVYTRKDKPVLNKLNIEFYTNHITSLLGHNGAGKSTLISILTGLHKPSNGSVFICGYNVQNQMDKIRNNLGFCPQHNILYEYLTIIEHIEFYAYLKGLNKQQIKQEIEYFTKLLNFKNKLNDQVKNLSGGEKRKLSIAIAFIGGASVILLDEPTTGVDPYSRRSIWDLILKAKVNKTIILTTHHMDEADILGDRIAIISHGKLKCYGSSLYLKSNYGQGYYLILEYKKKFLSNNNSTENFSTDTVIEQENFQDITNYLKGFISSIKLINVNQNELIFQIPLKNTYDGSLSRMLKHFEDQETLNEEMIILPTELYKYGIINYGLTDTSLEEIFLTIADDDSTRSFIQSNDNETQINSNHNKCEVNENINYSIEINQPIKCNYVKQYESQMNILRHSYRLSQCNDNGQLPISSTSFSMLNRKHYYQTINRLEENTIVTNKNNIQLNYQIKIIQQIKAMFIKRYHYNKRSIFNLFIEFILPIFVLILGLICLQVIKKTTIYQPLILTPRVMLNEKNNISLITFYENNLYELKNPIKNLMNKSDIYQSILHIAWNYEEALKKPYSWTGINCLPLISLKYIEKNFKLFGYCNNSSIKIIKKDLTFNEIQDIHMEQLIKCSKKSIYSLNKQPSSMILPNGDILFNLTSFNVSNYLLVTQNDYIRRRYGGLSYHMGVYPIFRSSLTSLLNENNYIISFLTNLTSKRDLNNNNIIIKPDHFWSDLIKFIRVSLPPISYLRIWFNNKGYISAPAYLNTLHNLQLRMLTNNGLGLNERNYSNGIIFINYPLNKPIDNNNNNNMNKNIHKEIIFDITLSIITLLCLSFIPASCITFIVKENCFGLKHLQYISGLNSYIYWLCVYLWDIINYIICAILCILVFIGFQKTPYIHIDVIIPFILLIILYGLAVIPLLYIISYFIQSSSTSLVFLSIFNLLIGSITLMCTIILDDFAENNLIIKYINNILKIIFILFPQYCLSRGLFNLAKRYYLIEFMNELSKSSIETSKLSIKFITNPYDWNILGSKICSLFIETIIYFLIVLLHEKNYFIQSIKNYFYINYPKLLEKHNMKFIQKLIKWNKTICNDNNNNNDNDSEDEDVRNERRRIEMADSLNQIHSLYSIAVINLTKFFPLKKKPSVNSLTFAVHPGECFGLLGLNGAGKTTTFNMITNYIQPSMGKVYINGYNMITQSKNAHQNLGYCPQFDAIHNLLTGRETLNFYARLRGINEMHISTIVSNILHNMGLSIYYWQTKSNLLDEPTSGMDPISRRFIWNQIISLIQQNCSILLTTHSMEECETLCQYIGIMINGQLKCFGSIQHLKKRYGNGYTVEIRFNPLTNNNNSNNMNEFKIKFQSNFPNSTLIEVRSCYYIYQMSKEIHLSALFTFLNDMQSKHIIEQYSVKQTTLDQVFVNFSRDQSEMIE